MIATLAMSIVLAAAQVLAQPISSDPRIRVVTYNAEQVVTLPVAPGYAAIVALGSEERVESIVVGNSDEWQVTASKRGDDVIVKPLLGASTTNMVIVTGSRHFVFQLQPGGSEDAAPYVLRFIYPQLPQLDQATPVVVSTFRFKGAKALFPAEMSDDGTRTRIKWSRSAQLPAIFAVERSGREAIVNGRMVGDTYVVERVAPRFLFRLGKATATSIRQTTSTQQ